MKKQQQGLTLIGLILVGALVIGTAIVGMRVTPSVIEYYTIMKHIKTIANRNPSTVAEVRKEYENRTIVDDTPSLTAADLDVTKEGSQIVISFEYAKKIPIAGNVSILIDYSGSTTGSQRRIE